MEGKNARVIDFYGNIIVIASLHVKKVGVAPSNIILIHVAAYIIIIPSIQNGPVDEILEIVDIHRCFSLLS